jgi:hypothetical protein
MSNNDVRKLPPMSALEFAIAGTFRNFVFSLRLAFCWLVVMSPLLAVAWYILPKDSMPNPDALPPFASAVLISIGVLAFLASLSVAVNWHRRLILGETPRRLGWIRLDGVVWKYLFCFLFVLVVLAAVGLAIFAALEYLPSALLPHIGPAAQPVSYGVAALVGLFGLFTWYRLSTWLPAVATKATDYGLSRAWRSTRRNRIRFLGFTFWLLFGLAIAGAIGAGAFLGQQMLANPWATGAAYALIGVLIWLALFLITSISASHYYFFGECGEFPE